MGQKCEVHFPEDGEWYAAVVRGFDRASKLHNLWYFYDQEVGTRVWSIAAFNRSVSAARIALIQCT